MGAMTPQIISTGFKVTGIYPTDCYRVLPKSPPRPPTLCERTGVKFIPLFTPLRCSSCSLTPTSYSRKIHIYYDDSLQGDKSMSANSTDDSLPSEPSVQSSTLPCPVFENSCLHVLFTQEEVIRFKKCKEEGCDITTDGRYNFWLSLQAKKSVVMLQPPVQSVVSKVLRSASEPPTIKYPDIMPNSSARVLTSEESRQELNEKQGKKLKILNERKLERPNMRGRKRKNEGVREMERIKEGQRDK